MSLISNLSAQGTCWKHSQNKWAYLFLPAMPPKFEKFVLWLICPWSPHSEDRGWLSSWIASSDEDKLISTKAHNHTWVECSNEDNDWMTLSQPARQRGLIAVHFCLKTRTCGGPGVNPLHLSASSLSHPCTRTHSLSWASTFSLTVLDLSSEWTGAPAT